MRKLKIKLNTLTALAILIILLSLVNWEIFGSVTANSSFFFSFGVFSFSIITGINFIRHHGTVKIKNPLPAYLFPGLITYYVIYSVVIQNQSIGSKHYLLPTYFIFLLTGCFLLSQGALKINELFKVITIIDVSESDIYISQLIRLLPSESEYFKVTSSWENPNVTTMFIALIIHVKP